MSFVTFLSSMNTSGTPFTNPTTSARRRRPSDPRTHSSRTQRKWLLEGSSKSNTRSLAFFFAPPAPA